MNKTIFIIGNGASLSVINKFTLNEIFNKYDTLCCNYWYPFGVELYGLYPTYYCIGDFLHVGFTPYKNNLDMKEPKREIKPPYNTVYKTYRESYYTHPILKQFMDISPIDYIYQKKNYF